ncbi:uncharacterized protein CEXT_603821 [Caerostris extrusa]|uniref:Uncharacterized protein n=1 Tax=Caerostris extrusa TaxID=172846 RepID=A0AAV4SXA5_CAEEX|nr:uncharacterized protein CEXT_603821 [Caerostris extrusa]
MLSCKKLIVLVAYLSTCVRSAGRVATATPDAVASRLDFDISKTIEKGCQGGLLSVGPRRFPGARGDSGQQVRPGHPPPGSPRDGGRQVGDTMEGCEFFEASAKFDTNVKDVFLQLLQMARTLEEAQEALLEEQDLFRRKSMRLSRDSAASSPASTTWPSPSRRTHLPRNLTNLPRTWWPGSPAAPGISRTIRSAC